MMGLSKNSAEVYPAKLYKAGVLAKLNDATQRRTVVYPAYRNFKCEIVGEFNREKNYPVQNMRINDDGTVISTSYPLQFAKGDNLYFWGKWWIIERVSFDVVSIEPQGGYWMPMRNAIATLTIRAIKMNGVGRYD